MNKKTFLITGGAGYIGSYVARKLMSSGHTVVILDNLSRGIKYWASGEFIAGDVGDLTLLESLFKAHHFDAVFHFAGSISVAESFAKTSEYYENNVIKSLLLLNTMLKFNVKRFIFSSSAAIYGIAAHHKIQEGDPFAPINPYGRTKLMIEMALKDYSEQHGLCYAALRYFNAAGADPELKVAYYPRKECNLIPIILGGLLNPSFFQLKLNGADFNTPDGTCVRDYIHLDDLCRAHLLAYEYLTNHHKSLAVNLGNGEGYSNLEVIRCCEEVSGLKLNYTIGPRRAGDAPKLVADASLAKALLLWEPKYVRLRDMVEHAWYWMRAK